MESANDLAQLALRTCGGRSMLKNLPLERLYRDSRCGSVMMPWTAEICLDRIGRESLYEAGGKGRLRRPQRVMSLQARTSDCSVSRRLPASLPITARRRVPRTSALRANHSVAASSGSTKRISPPDRVAVGHAVAIEQAVAGERRKPRPRRQDAGEVERIGARHRRPFVGRRPAAHLAQQCRSPRAGRTARPEKPATKRPPRISPLLSSRR